MTDTAVVQQFRVAKLIMVTVNNNNKFYEMQQIEGGQFQVKYGRVGSRASTATYPIRQWDSKYNEKIRKGYTDQTHLYAKKATEQTLTFTDIREAVVTELMQQLMRFARQSIGHNYHVAAEEVTLHQVAEAQSVLDALVGQITMTLDVTAFNKQLIHLYQIIPRKMAKVMEHLIEKPKTKEDITAIRDKMAAEQETLDVMRGQVELLGGQKEDNEATKNELSLLETMGLKIEEEKGVWTLRKIKKMMGTEKSRFKRAFQVKNIHTQAPYDNFLAKAKNKKTELFWHGSRNENWLSILQAGLVLRPANAVITGKMFGYGLYFADQFRKSLNYTSLYGSYWANGNQNQAFLALYDVHVGEQFKIKNYESWCSGLTEEKLKAKNPNYDSLYALGGADLINNEYIIYNQHQCTIRYLVEVTV